MTRVALARPFRIAFRIGAALFAAALTACAGGAGGARGAAQPSPQPAAEGEDAAVARARADSARHPYTAADVHFMTVMIGHHSQAITIAGWAPTHGASPAVRTLAERIVNGQQDEIATMQRWLRDRRQPVPDVYAVDTTVAHASGHEMHGTHATPMAGMLTAAQLRQLHLARGAEFDRLFLTFMIQHHRGAVSMVKALFGSYGAAQDETVFKFASDVNVDQTTEITRMERMLADLLVERRAP